MNTLMKLTATALLSAMFLLSGVGALYLFNTRPLATEPTTCDRIVRYEDNSLVCHIIMHNEDDNLIVMKGSRL